MPKKYPEYLREEAVKQYLAGRRAEELAADVGCSQSTIYKWVNKHWKEGSENDAADRS